MSDAAADSQWTRASKHMRRVPKSDDRMLCLSGLVSDWLACNVLCLTLQCRTLRPWMPSPNQHASLLACFPDMHLRRVALCLTTLVKVHSGGGAHCPKEGKCQRGRQLYK